MQRSNVVEIGGPDQKAGRLQRILAWWDAMKLDEDFKRDLESERLLEPDHTARQRRRWALVLAIGLVVAHIIMIWGITSFRGDAARWRHEAERIAQGQTLYKDFVWPYPPVALWMVGWAARALGSGTTMIFAICSGIVVAITLAYWQYTTTLLRGVRASSYICPLGMLLAIAYAKTAGDALPAGMYTPAAPIGLLFLLIALCGWLSGKHVVTGIACGLAIGTKQDYWLPVLAILGTGFVKNRKGAFTACVSATAVVFGIAAIVLVQAGPDALLSIPLGYDRVRFESARWLPSLQRITAIFAALTLMCAAGLYVFRRFRLAIISFGLCALSTGLLFAKSLNFGDFRSFFFRYQVPFLIPIGFLVFAIRKRYTGLACLLVIALAARARRGFEATEWFSLLIELPVYALILNRQSLPAVPKLAAFVAAIGLVSYWHYGVGPFTHKADRVWVQTEKGPVSWMKDEAQLYQLLHSAIGPGTSPLFAFGYTGGFNYYLNRPNPCPSDEGIMFSGRDPEQVIQEIRRARPILLDSHDNYDRGVMISGASLTSWRNPTSPVFWNTVERPLYQKVAEGCTETVVKGTKPLFTLCRFP